MTLSLNDMQMQLQKCTRIAEFTVKNFTYFQCKKKFVDYIVLLLTLDPKMKMKMKQKFLLMLEEDRLALASC